MKAGWVVKCIGEVCDIQSGAGFPKKDQGCLDAEFPFFKVGDMNTKGNERELIISNNYISEETRMQLGAKLMPVDSVVFPKVGGAISTNKKRRIVMPSCVDNNVMGLSPRSNFISADYLAWWMDGFDIYEFSNKAALPSITQKTVSRWPIPLPPLDEQKRIVAVLDAAFDGLARARANVEANLQNARELFESVLNEIVSNATKEYKAVTLSEITLSITDGDHSAPPKTDAGIPFITISNVNKKTRKIDFSNTFKVPEEYYKNLKDNRRPKLGDVLYTVTGSFGIPVHVTSSKPFCFQRHIGLVRPKENLDSLWLFYLLMSPNVYRQADDGASGAAQRTVTLKQLRGFIVPDLPLDKQRKFGYYLEKQFEEAQKLEAHYQSKLTDLDELRQSLLQKAFAGELS